MIIDAISDLHGHYPELDGGDLLIVAGDLTRRDDEEGFHKFRIFILRNWPKYKKVIVIAGNHDENFHKMIMQQKEIWNGTQVYYLCDSGTEFEYEEPCDENKEKIATLDTLFSYKKKVKIWGSPWTKSFPGMNPKCKAFTLDTEEELAEKWKLIPNDIDILVTHSPALGVLDEIKDYTKGQILNVGSESLIKPMIKSGCKLHIFGHIHEGYGKFHNAINGITYVNASHVNEHYEPINKPIRVIL